MTNELEIPIGTIAQPQLAAGSVIVKDVTIEPAKEGSKAKIVRVHCKHPSRDELVLLSNIKLRKVQGNNETIKRDALWWNLDTEGNIKMNSAVADFLKFYSKKKLEDFKGIEIKTEHDAAGYLCIKAY